MRFLQVYCYKTKDKLTQIYHQIFMRPCLLTKKTSCWVAWHRNGSEKNAALFTDKNFSNAIYLNKTLTKQW